MPASSRSGTRPVRGQREQVRGREAEVRERVVHGGQAGEARPAAMCWTSTRPATRHRPYAQPSTIAHGTSSQTPALGRHGGEREAGRQHEQAGSGARPRSSRRASGWTARRRARSAVIAAISADPVASRGRRRRRSGAARRRPQARRTPREPTAPRPAGTRARPSPGSDSADRGEGRRDDRLRRSAQQREHGRPRARRAGGTGRAGVRRPLGEQAGHERAEREPCGHRDGCAPGGMRPAPGIRRARARAARPSRR